MGFPRRSAGTSQWRSAGRSPTRSAGRNMGRPVDTSMSRLPDGCVSDLWTEPVIIGHPLYKYVFSFFIQPIFTFLINPTYNLKKKKKKKKKMPNVHLPPYPFFGSTSSLPPK